MSSSLMALPDWQMSISSNASSAAMKLIFQALSVPFTLLARLFRDSPRARLFLVFLTVLILGDDASGPTDRTEEQRAIVD